MFCLFHMSSHEAEDYFSKILNRNSEGMQCSINYFLCKLQNKYINVYTNK